MRWPMILDPGFAITTDTQGLITGWNPMAARFFGYSAVEVLGRHWRLLLADDCRGVEDDVQRRLTTESSADTFDTTVRRQDESRRSIRVTVTAIQGRGGEVIGGILSVRDRMRDGDELPAEKQLAAIVDSSDDAIVSKDLNGTVTSWNRAAERMFGYLADEMIGTSIRRIIPADRQTEEDEVLERIRSGRKVDHFDTVRQRKDGTLVPISLTVSPMRADDGRIVGASKIARDVSDRQCAELEHGRLLDIAERNAAVTDTLNRVGSIVASTLDRESVVQAVTDAATELTTAQFGAFFYNVDNERGESYTLYTISGVPREEFSKFPMPRNTALFEPTFRGTAVVRCDDVTTDPRYGHNAPHFGQPKGHLPVRSYLAVPVRSPSGDVLGGLFFGHSDIGRFTDDHERLAVGIATWASVALENARLYRSLADASRLKDEFLATLSHELRTPLNAILGYTRMLRSGLLALDKHPRALEIVERNAVSLTQIVEDVLDVSRIIAGKIRLNVQQVDIADAIHRAIDAVQPSADLKAIRIHSVLDSHAGPVAGDPERLQQIVWNLLANAVKFTNRGGRIEVRLERVDSTVMLVVSDTGVGIAPEFLPHLFERFRQADAGTARLRGGLGLGLAIVSQLVELHGGSIRGESEGLGKGATFTVSLPIMVAMPRAAPPEREPSRAPVESTLAPPSLAGLRVLAVDDDADALAMIRDILEACGGTVLTASSTDLALALLAKERPDVLVADIGMPSVDGFELIARIRQQQDPRISNLPAAALTAYARSEDRTRALRAGFQMHLAKPINPSELIEAVLVLSRYRRA
jgi:PAS domain S-box-containing protein